MPRNTSHVFTINNFTEDDIKAVQECVCNSMKAGYEVGAKGTPHIQGAVYWGQGNQCSFKKASERLGGRASMQVMRGTWDQQDYCLKDGEICRQIGDGPQQGKRNDIIALRDAIKRRATDEELCEEHPQAAAKYKGFISFARNAYKTHPKKIARLAYGTKRMGIWLCGPSNMGKTSWVQETYPDCYNKTCTRWWDNYEGEEVVLIDDPKRCWKESFWDSMKQWINEIPFQAQKGVGQGMMWIRFTKIIVTCNYTPQEYFGDSFNMDAFESRWVVRVVEEKMY